MFRRKLSILLNVLEQPSQSPDLNPNKDLWKKGLNLQELVIVTKEEWSKILVEMYKKLVSNYKKRLIDVVTNKGFGMDCLEFWTWHLYKKTEIVKMSY